MGEVEERLEVAAQARRAATRLARRLRAERPAGALSPNKVAVLAHLYRHGKSTPGEITAAEHQQPQSLTRVFAELQTDGLVSRSRGERDRRESVLDLTAAGLDVLTKDMADRDRWLADAIGGLSEMEIQMLRIGSELMNQLADAP
jgi:DNA-binding MarR family transcriptional regulator